MTFYFNQRVDGQSLDPKVGDGSTNHNDVHDDRTSRLDLKIS